jgi:hypothetical protein
LFTLGMRVDAMHVGTKQVRMLYVGKAHNGHKFTC